MNRLLMVPLAATIAVAMSAGPAMAVTVYDARTLGMGGSSVGYSGNASLAYWNPAAVAMNRTWGVYLPSLSVSLGNNILSVGEAQALVAGAQSGSGNGLKDVFTKLGSSNGLNLQLEALTEVIGLSLGNVGPGALAVRVYGHALTSARANLSRDFSDNLDSLFVQGGFGKISAAVQDITKSSSSVNSQTQSELRAKANTLATALRDNMSSFIKKDNQTPTVKQFELSTTTGANVAAAVTYAQPLNYPIPMFPDAQLTVGATAKLFGSPASTLASISAQPLPDGSSTGNDPKISPLNGSASIKLDIDKEVSDLVDAIERFDKDQNLATGADLIGKSSAFFNAGLSKSSIAFSTLTPDNVGGALDLGAAAKLNKQWSVGLSLINPIMLWGATRQNYTYDFSGATIRRVAGATEHVGFSAAEPFIVRLGTAWQPEIAGPPILTRDLMLGAGIEAPLNNGVGPSVHLGVEKLFGPLALRLGTQQGGISSLYSAGVGVQTKAFQLNLGAGTDNPGNPKSAAASLTLGAGF